MKRWLSMRHQAILNHIWFSLPIPS